MALTKQRKAYLLVLMLAGSGFGYDRLFLDGGVSAPAPAAAGEATVPVAGKRAGKADAESVPAVTVDHSALAGRMAALRSQAAGNRVDGFSIPAAWRAPVEEPKASEKQALPAMAVQLDKLRITGIMAERGAIISGKFVRVGEVSDGVLLVSVTNVQVVVRDEVSGREMTFKVARPETNQRISVHKG